MLLLRGPSVVSSNVDIDISQDASVKNLDHSLSTSSNINFKFDDAGMYSTYVKGIVNILKIKYIFF